MEPRPHRPAHDATTPAIGEVYLSAPRSSRRVAELGAQIATDYAGREPLLVGLLKASFVFLADLSRAMPILHQLDFVELAGYGGAADGRPLARPAAARTSTTGIDDRDVLLVEDVVDTGLTLHYLCRTFELRKPGEPAVATLLDRPYRRLVDDLPGRYVGFTVPDEFFVGYGFDLDERWRNLPTCSSSGSLRPAV